MYLGIDIGGTKILVAVLNNDGVIVEQLKFPTPKKYPDFLEELTKVLGSFKNKDFEAIGVGLPGRIDREHGIFVGGANLAWANEHIKTDLIQLTHTPVVVENDAKLATLSEAMLLKHKYERVLYITISTGIGAGVAVKQKLDPDFLNIESGQAVFEHHGRMMRWEKFASGKAIVERFGKIAGDINDQATWKIIVRNLTPGFMNLIANVQPDVIVIGGSVGTHFDKYGKLLEAELQKYETPLTPIPPLKKSKRPEEAVVYGCYDLAKSKFPIKTKVST
jgi:glucokinase